MKKIIVLSIFLLLITATPCFASPIEGITQPTIVGTLADDIGGIVGIIQIVGTAVAVAASIYLGIRYIMSSVNEKADIKKKMIPFVIGLIIFYGATGILQLIANVGNWFNT